MFFELETSPIQVKNLHDTFFTLKETIFQVTVLFPVEIFFTFGREAFQHILGDLLNVGLQVTRTGIHHIVNQEGDELFLT